MTTPRVVRPRRIRLTIVSLAGAIGLIAVSRGPLRADEVKLDNGDVLHGKVTGADDKNITLKHEFGSEMKIPLEKVFSILTDEPTTIRLKDGTTLKGKLVPGSDARTVGVDSPQGREGRERPFTDVVSIGDLPPDVIWSGKVALGLTIQDGNTRGETFFGSFDGQRQTKQDLLEGHAYYTYGRTFDQLTTRKSFARLQYDYKVWDPLYVYVGAALQYDKFQDLRLRARGGAGVGYAWIETREMNFRTEVGAEYVNEEHFVQPDDDYAALRGAFTFDWQILEWLKFHEFFEIFPDMDRFSKFNTHSETSLTAAVWKGFGVAAILIWDYNTMAPPPRFRRNDEQYILTLTYVF
jgi:putative salt-induced outer membrane protein YdiY